MATKPSFITDLISHAGHYGFQKANKFIVFINGPGTEQRRNNLIDIVTLQRLALTCTGASFPGRLISTEDVKYYNLGTKMPNFETYSQTLSLNFLCSTDMFERMYFKNWQDKVMNPRTHSPNLYDSYAKPFTITIMVLPDYVNSFDQLGNPLAIGNDSRNTSIDPRPFDDQTPDTSGIYFVKCLECYPTEITEVPLSSNTGGVLEIKVTLAFRKWVDPIEQFYAVAAQNDMSESSRAILRAFPTQALVWR